MPHCLGLATATICAKMTFQILDRPFSSMAIGRNPPLRIAPTRVDETEKPVAITLKIDTETYARLGTLGANGRKTAQDILTEALRAYLDRARVWAAPRGFGSVN